MSAPLHTEPHARWRALLSGRPLPAVIIDLAAVEAAVEAAVRQVSGAHAALRMDSAALPAPALLRRVQSIGAPRVWGILAPRVEDAVLLCELGYTDVQVTHPAITAAEAAMARGLIGAGADVVLPIDHPAHLRPLASEDGPPIPVVITLCTAEASAATVSTAVRDSEQTRELAAAAAETPGVTVAGLWVLDALGGGRRLLGGRARVQRQARCRAAVEALRAGGHTLRRVLGDDPTDTAVSELLIGPGMLANAVFEARPVVGLPTAERAVVPGPVGALPIIQPAGARFIARTTDLPTAVAQLPGADAVRIGDPLILGGGLPPGATEVLLVRGGEVVEIAPTFAGLR